MAAEKITWDMLLQAYAAGYFPMAESRSDPKLYWFYPESRGILPLESFHVPRRLARFYRGSDFTFTADTAFPEVIAACAEETPTRKQTWINDSIIELYCEVWKRGYAHSIECWQEKTLVGGIYGIALGGAFFGESMFSRATNASKAALVHLVERLKSAGYVLFDTQFVNEHIKQFGVMEITRAEYLERLEKALEVKPADAF